MHVQAVVGDMSQDRGDDVFKDNDDDDDQMEITDEDAILSFRILILSCTVLLAASSCDIAQTVD